MTNFSERSNRAIMEIPIYKNVSDFRDNIEIDYLQFKTEMPYLKYLKFVRNKYTVLESLEKLRHTNLPNTAAFNFDKFLLSFSKVTDELQDFDPQKDSLQEYQNILLECFNTPHLEQSRKYADIIRYLNDRINTETVSILKQSPHDHFKSSETPENDYSDTVPLERMIILEKLGIIKYIQSLQNDNLNEKHTAEILSSFTGIISGTIAKNLGVMGEKKKDSDKNSPYKNPKNLQLANKKLDKFNIDLTKIIK